MPNNGFDLSKIEGFDWDDANIEKNWTKHKVYYKEAEEVFFDRDILVGIDIKHSSVEKRYQGIGKTNNNRVLFISFTFRTAKVRVISARPANRKEKEKYEKKAQKNT